MDNLWKSLKRKYPDICTYRSVSRKIRKKVSRKASEKNHALGKPGAYVYADESGNSGKGIFSEQSPIYYQGAILSVGEIDNAVAPIIERYCDQNNLERLHGYELGEAVVNSICIDLIKALEGVDWQFHYTAIEKRYISPTKFVDTVFDCYDNPAVHPLWYTTELFRHTLCILIDDMMEGGVDVAFWQYYLADDVDGLIEICGILLERAPHIFDKRACEVVTDGLEYAIQNPDIFTLIAAKGKSAYKKQTPNIVAFSSLLTATHRFCNKFGTSVSELIHDQSDEFKGTMREYHRMFFGVDYEEDEFGGIPQFKEVEYELGTFKLESSKNSYGLQVADLFLWLVQRDVNDEDLKQTKALILENCDDYFISRNMSLAIVKARHHQVMQQDITPEQMQAGKQLNKQIVANQLRKMKK
ncbi:DUF3800 domain-containing protein [Thalassolituus sp. UBA3500]|uniref:DUF3800 domain-containing protein n=1 Tax=Thalassolituus sp. UBA3500 TaxID=1947664 RepID=UPI00263A931B|nr:DUF3800 domain-containing protein [Thalassolituus sp. UBA3500]|tara:strand:- start:2497 stop:3735 length:1239 start_codon:yes stop_codon:yes gene_type:complete